MAILQVLSKYFIQGFLTFTIKIYEEITPKMKDIIDSLGKLNDEIFMIEIEIFKEVNAKDCIYHDSAFIFISKIEILNKINAVADVSSFRDPTLKFVIFCENFNHFLFIPIPLTERTFQNGHIIQHEYIITNQNNSINLMTIKYFTDKACDKPQIIKLDEFNKTTQRWQNNLTETNNGRNFHGCLISFSMEIFKDGAYLKKYSSPKESIETGGFFQGITDMASKFGNFTPNYQIAFKHTYLSNQRLIMTKSIQYKIGLSNSFEAICIFDNLKLSIAVTPTEYYSNYEKVFMPFDVTSWILFSFSFFIVFLAISIIQKKLSRKIQNLIFGVKIRNPGYNAMSGFFGISQSKLPTENCPRILLIFFLYFCLVFRTCYQGRMFDFLTSDMRKPYPENVEDLIEQKYEIYQIKNTRDAINDERAKIIKLYQIPFVASYCKNMQSTTSKSAYTIVGYIDRQIFNQYCPVKPEKMFFINTFSVHLVAFGMAQNCLLRDIVHDAFEKMFTFGLIQYLRKNENEIKYPNIPDNPVDNKKILTLDILEYGFVLYLIACAVAFCVFLIEVFRPKFKKFVKNSIALFFIIKWLRNRMKNFHA
ncbi:hypothetical protein PVAND_009390 [Polypedilum vanderplanki]|uniref:Ionotropic receptor n=1 Tax=Polypedilum vanderplanki TaxID=319348 RepID=A0A9J6CD51_POLVA|nr:hypothetical protein PVAND_009390 [Polypedilum vanderplanki]